MSRGFGWAVNSRIPYYHRYSLATSENPWHLEMDFILNERKILYQYVFTAGVRRRHFAL